MLCVFVLAFFMLATYWGWRWGWHGVVAKRTLYGLCVFCAVVVALVLFNVIRQNDGASEGVVLVEYYLAS